MNNGTEQDKLAEGENLRSLLAGWNKAQFAREHGLNPSMIGQQMRGERPISLAYAKVYAKALSKTLAEVSPYWAAQADLADVDIGSVPAEAQPAWPFSPDLLAQVLNLNDRERLQLEGAMWLTLAQISPIEGRKQKAA